jgi:2-aminoadipate transaminase
MKNQFNTKFSGNFNNIPKSFIREILEVATQNEMISFAGGLPNPAFFPVKELEQSAIEVLRNQGTSVLQYAGSQGYLPLREWIANRYSRKYQMHIKPENVVITNGSQQTIDVVAKMFLNKGDGVIVEKPTYLGGIQALSAYLPQFLSVDLREDGPDLKQVEEHCLNNCPKFMYAIPNFQNPSGLCYSKQKREKLALLLKEYNLLFLEDDPYNEIRFDGDDLKPLFSYVPDQVFWTGSFSKMVAPGLRMGWVVLPDGLAPHFIKAKQSTDLHSNNLTQYMLYHYLTHNNIDEHLCKIRNGYKQQCGSMKEMIAKYFPKNVKATSPQGGMFLWLTLPDEIDSEVLIGDCLKKGVAFVPGRSFFTSGKGNQHIRMNFTNSSFENMEKGIRIMANELAKYIGEPLAV